MTGLGGEVLDESVVCALHQGPEEHYAVGEKIAAAMFAPILNIYRITVEQMAILEPAVVESTMATCIAAMREAMDRAVALGVPEQAARDFCLGHIRTLTAVTFGFAGFPISDGAMKAIEQNRPRIVTTGKKKSLACPLFEKAFAISVMSNRPWV